jgi:hypothetical protein
MMNGEPPFLAFLKFLLLFGIIPIVMIVFFAMMGARVHI